MTVIHIVLLKFKEGLDAATISSSWEEVLALKDTCIHPETKKPYIKSLGGGTNNSIEGVNFGLTHGFVYEFESEKDRNYYVKEDAAHIAVVAKLKEVVEDIRVVDFTPGAY